MADTKTLPSLTESMTAADLVAHCRALRDELGGEAEVYCDVRVNKYSDPNKAAGVQIYPLGICSPGDNQHLAEATWPEVFAKAAEWVRANRTVARDKRIRQMALAIIDITDTYGRCDRSALIRRNFTSAEIDALSALACERAGEMAGNAPFSVEGV